MTTIRANFLNASIALLAFAFVGQASAVTATEKIDAITFASIPYFCEILTGGSDCENDASDPAYSVALADATLVADKSFKEGLDSLRTMCSASETKITPPVDQQVDAKP